MINREEIHTKIVEYLDENPFYSEDLIDIFISTIGSCGECKHREFVDGYARCRRLHIVKNDDWYCADFERKEDAKSN